MRSGEMLALTLNDFDFEERTVSITKNYARIDGEDLFLDPKTPKSNRKITLPQFVCDLVKDYADRLYGYDPSDRLFEVTKHYLKHEMERLQEDRTPGDTGARSSSQPRQLAD